MATDAPMAPKREISRVLSSRFRSAPLSAEPIDHPVRRAVKYTESRNVSSPASTVATVSTGIYSHAAR